VSRGALQELVVRAVGELVSAGKEKGSSLVAAFSCLARSHSGLPPNRSHIIAEEAKYKLCKVRAAQFGDGEGGGVYQVRHRSRPVSTRTAHRAPRPVSTRTAHRQCEHPHRASA
jgi:hypothetical protein